jgi:hypothetical protein
MSSSGPITGTNADTDERHICAIVVTRKGRGPLLLPRGVIATNDPLDGLWEVVLEHLERAPVERDSVTAVPPEVTIMASGYLPDLPRRWWIRLRWRIFGPPEQAALTVYMDSGRPLTIPICHLCGVIGWADIREQLVALAAQPGSSPRSRYTWTCPRCGIAYKLSRSKPRPTRP